MANATKQPPYLHNLISVQRSRSIRSSSVVTLVRPPSFVMLHLVSWPLCVGPGYPLSPLFHSLPHFLIFTFPFVIRFTYFLLLPIPSLSIRIDPHCFQAGGRMRQSNLGLVCCVHFVLSVLLS